LGGFGLVKRKVGEEELNLGRRGKKKNVKKTGKSAKKPVFRGVRQVSKHCIFRHFFSLEHVGVFGTFLQTAIDRFYRSLKGADFCPFFRNFGQI
jgi:hypothetical protein